MPRLPLIAAALLLAVPGMAVAQPKLVLASPAANAAVVKPMAIRLSFDAPLDPASGLDLVMTAMPGMKDHPPMPIKGFKVVAAGKDLTAALPRPLPSGTYALKWHAAGADRQHGEGSYTFTVR